MFFDYYIYSLRTEQSSLVLHWFQRKKPDPFTIKKTNEVKGFIATSKSYPHPMSWWPDPGAFENHLEETKNEMQSPVSCCSPCKFHGCNKFKTKKQPKISPMIQQQCRLYIYTGNSKRINSSGLFSPKTPLLPFSLAQVSGDYMQK